MRKTCGANRRTQIHPTKLNAPPITGKIRTGFEKGVSSMHKYQITSEKGKAAAKSIK